MKMENGQKIFKRVGGRYSRGRRQRSKDQSEDKNKEERYEGKYKKMTNKNMEKRKI